MSDDPRMSQLKSLTRQRLRIIWDTAQLGLPLEDEDAQTAAIMREHTEWQQVWAHVDQLSDAEIERDGVNPIMHVTVHQAVLNQINGALPAAQDAFEALLTMGIERHEAIHRIGTVLTEGIYETLKFRRPFDEEKYSRGLKALTKPPPLHRPPRRVRRR
jgi:hypothetical protein